MTGPGATEEPGETLQGTVTRSGMLGMLQALWVYRRFVLSMVAREFRGRYLGSLLGGVWAVLSPLALILIYMVIFSAVMRGRLPHGQGDSLSYGIFLCTGILCWGFFAEVVSKCQVVFVEYANLLKKMSFPRITLPVVVLLTAVVNFSLIAILFLVLLLVLQRFPGWSIVAFLPLLVVQQAFATGLGIFLGTLHVFFRDVGQAWTVLVNLWFWVTPIVYHLDILPEAVQPIIRWNPLTPLFQSYQAIVLANRWPVWGELWWPALMALIFLVLGLYSFRRLAGEMVDEL